MRLDRAFAAGLLALASATGCGRPAPAPAAAPVSAGPAITTVKLERRPVKRTVEQPGSIHPFEETVLYPKIPGYVRAILADPDKAARPAHDRLIDIGSRVTQGQVLAELAVPELEEEYKQKEAVVRRTEAEVTQARKALAASVAGVAAARADVTVATAGLSREQANYERWQSEIDRITKLVTGGVIDSQTRDETRNQFKSAEAGRNEATAKVTSAEATVAKAEADRDKAIADVTAAEAVRDVSAADVLRVAALREYLRLKAPFDGVVTRRAVSTGDYVTADGKQGLFAVARIDPVRVVVSVPEADAALVTVGQPVAVTLPATAVTGTVARTSWALEPGSRTLRVEVDLPNPDGQVRPGTYAYTKFTADLPAEWSVPTAAVGTVNGEPVLYLAEGGKAVRVAVQLHKGDARFTQVRRYKRAGATDWTDISGGEVVATPASALTDGQALPQ
jgi:RND family efflux transporter MFP subunit